MEPSHPLFETAVIGIDVLNVKRVEQDPFTGRGVDRLMQQAISGGKGRQDRRAISEEQGVRCDDRPQHMGYGFCIELGEDEVGGDTMSIPSHQHCDLFGGSPRPFGFAATFSSRPFQMAVPFLGVQKQCLINFEWNFICYWV